MSLMFAFTPRSYMQLFRVAAACYCGAIYGVAACRMRDASHAITSALPKIRCRRGGTRCYASVEAQCAVQA